MQYCSSHLRDSNEIPFFALKLQERNLNGVNFVRKHFFFV